jgi:hypothetical protein
MARDRRVDSCCARSGSAASPAGTYSRSVLSPGGTPTIDHSPQPSQVVTDQRPTECVAVSSEGPPAAPAGPSRTVSRSDDIATRAPEGRTQQYTRLQIATQGGTVGGPPDTERPRARRSGAAQRVCTDEPMVGVATDPSGRAHTAQSGRGPAGHLTPALRRSRGTEGSSGSQPPTSSTSAWSTSTPTAHPKELRPLTPVTNRTRDSRRRHPHE